MSQPQPPRQLLMRKPSLDGLPDMTPLPEPYGIRPYRPGDEGVLGAILQAEFEPDWSAAKVLEMLVNEPTVRTVYVATYADTPVGTTSARYLPQRFPGCGYVHYVAVASEHRGKRLGYLLCLRVLQEFRDAGCTAAVLETDDYRLPAIKTYLNLGFEPEPVDPSHPDRWRAVMEQIQRH